VDEEWCFHKDLEAKDTDSLFVDKIEKDRHIQSKMVARDQG